MHTNAYSLYDTDYAKNSGFDKSTSQVIRFLIENSNLCISENTMDEIFNTRTAINNSMSLIYNNATHSRVINVFTGIYPYSGRSLINIPDLLTFPAITLDLATIPHRDVLKSSAVYDNKIILNLAGVIKMEGIGDRAFVSDIVAIQNQVVRGLLMRSYYLSQNKSAWLTPAMGKYLIKTYALVISDIIQKTYGLNAHEQMTVSVLLAAYMTKRIISFKDGIPNPGFLFDFPGSDKKMINDIAEPYQEKFSGTYTIADMCECIANSGPARLKGFNDHYFYQVCDGLCSRDFSSTIALEYPPYWAYHLLLDASGSMSRMSPIMKRYRFNKEALLFAKDLNMSRTFIPDIEDAM